MRNFDKTNRNTSRASYNEVVEVKGRKLNKTQRGNSNKRMWNEEA